MNGETLLDYLSGANVISSDFFCKKEARGSESERKRDCERRSQRGQ